MNNDDKHEGEGRNDEDGRRNMNTAELTPAQLMANVASFKNEIMAKLQELRYVTPMAHGPHMV